MIVQLTFHGWILGQPNWALDGGSAEGVHSLGSRGEGRPTPAENRLLFPQHGIFSSSTD